MHVQKQTDSFFKMSLKESAGRVTVETLVKGAEALKLKVWTPQFTLMWTRAYPSPKQMVSVVKSVQWVWEHETEAIKQILPVNGNIAGSEPQFNVFYEANGFIFCL